MQNIVRYTKILMNIGTKILFVLLGLFLIYEIAYVFIHNYGSEGIYFYICLLLNISSCLVHCIFTLTFTTNREKNYTF